MRRTSCTSWIALRWGAYLGIGFVGSLGAAVLLSVAIGQPDWSSRRVQILRNENGDVEGLLLTNGIFKYAMLGGSGIMAAATASVDVVSISKSVPRPHWTSVATMSPEAELIDAEVVGIGWPCVAVRAGFLRRSNGSSVRVQEFGWVPAMSNRFACQVYFPGAATNTVFWTCVGTVLVRYTKSRLRRSERLRCQKCGYLLEGLRGRTEVCPECGTPIAAAGRTT